MGKPPSRIWSEGGVVPVVAENEMRNPPARFCREQGGGGGYHPERDEKPPLSRLE